MQEGKGRLDASAARAGVVMGPKIENNGSVSVVVQRPGPDTAVRTSASGNLFKDDGRSGWVMQLSPQSSLSGLTLVWGHASLNKFVGAS